ncbi:uncharacterized protein LOC143563395 [Bidens hawaiensis]|uniref:uncharacterized protein LOC143563395 n=1 Tax=Bidens hawaiensis TaxID=980011 RepID=UPI00404ADEB3
MLLLLPRFQELNLIHLDNLNQIGDGVAKGITHGQSKFHQLDMFLWQNSNKIYIEECHALSSVIPCYAAEQMQNLQELSIKECNTMEEIFETKVINHNNISGCSSSTKVPIPRPTNIATHKLPNLKILNIHKCDCLEFIFTLSTLKSLKNLKMLEISYCKAMKVIVKEEAREDTMEISQPMVFPQLKSVELDSLPNLAGFFLGVNTDFQWPLLEHVMINVCPQMRVFTASQSTAPRLKYIHTKLGKHNLECGLNFYETPTLRDQTPSLHGIRSHPTVPEKRTWSLYNLIECNYYDDERTKIFKSNELRQLQNLETIHFCANHDSPNYCVKEVFEVASEVTTNTTQTVVNIPKLREVHLLSLNSLKYIWKNNHRRILEFPNLTT